MGEQPYTLEVGSPGIDRPLTEPRHFRRNVSRLVTLTPLEGEPVTGRHHRRRRRPGSPSRCPPRRRSRPVRRRRVCRGVPGRGAGRVLAAFRPRGRAPRPPTDDHDENDDAADDVDHLRSTDMDIDLAALRALERERDISLDVLIPAIEQALLVAYHRTDGAYRNCPRRARPQDRARRRLGARRSSSSPSRAREPTTSDATPRRRRPSAPARVRPGVRRHPDRLRPDRRRHGPPGHRAAAARPRGRRDHGRLQGSRGRRRRRRHPAEPRPAGRDRRLRHRRGHPAARRAGAGGEATSTASGCAASSCPCERGPKGPQIGLSRTHPNLVRKLFALEVPEIADGSRRDRGAGPRGRPPHQDRGPLQGRRASTPRAPASARWAPACAPS